MEASLAEAFDRLAGVLAGGALTVVTSCLLGRIAVGSQKQLRGKLTVAEGWLLSFAVGCGLLSLLVFLLCAARQFSDAAVLLTAAGVLAGWYRWGRWRWPARPADGTGSTRISQFLLVVPATVYGVLYLVHTLAPETRTDAMGYHLGLVQRYYRAGGFVPLTTNLYAHLSQGAELLYLFAYSIGRESAAKLVHLSFLVACTGSIVCLARRLGAPLAGTFAAVVFFTCPVVIPDATSAYNDCALAFALFASACVLALWWQDREPDWLALLGILAGFAFSVKYTGAVAFAAPAAAAASVLARKDGVRAALRIVAVCAIPAAVLGLPWLLKNAVITGNPLAPFFNSWFPNPYVSVEWEAAYTFAMRSYQAGPFSRWEQLLTAPFELVLGKRYAGSLGWMALLAPIGLLAWRRPPARWLLAAAAVCALPWLANAGARFLIPAVPFAMLAAGLAVTSLPRHIAVAAVALLLGFQSVSSWPGSRDFWYYSDLWSVEGFPWRAALGLEPEKWHLARNVKSFLLADELNRRADAATRVLSFGNLPEAYFQAELLVSYQALENQDLADALLSSLKEERRPKFSLHVRWPETQADGLRVIQARSSGRRPWIVSEIRPLRHGRPLPADAVSTSWSEPLRWHAKRLFDGDIFWEWNSREPARPGMVLEAVFANSMLIDGVQLIHPPVSTPLQLDLDFAALQRGDGWTQLSATAAAVEQLTVTSSEARRAAARALRRHGIDYVVIGVGPQDPYFAQTKSIASDPAAWGLRKVFVDRSAVLLEVLPGPR